MRIPRRLGVRIQAYYQARSSDKQRKARKSLWVCSQGLHDPFGFFGDEHGPTHQEDSGVGSALVGPAPGKNEEVAYIVGNKYPHGPGRCFQHGLVRRSLQAGLCEVQDINAPHGEDAGYSHGNVLIEQERRPPASNTLELTSESSLRRSRRVQHGQNLALRSGSP